MKLKEREREREKQNLKAKRANLNVFNSVKYFIFIIGTLCYIFIG